MSASAPLEPFDSLMRSWTGMMLAPQKLMQSFNNGWSFANLTINSMNSSAPDTEQAIVAVESYGRQIGKLLDAVDLLVKQQSDWREHAAFSEVDALKRRIDEAARYVPLDQLCLSPQCGFSSTVEGNELTVDDQKRKLELIVSVAEDVWGR